MQLKYFFLPVSFILFLINNLSGQTQPENNSPAPEPSDTVIIKKEAVVVRKVLYIEEEVKPSNKFLEVYLSSFYNFNYYDVCKDCKAYLDKLKEVTSPKLGYSAGFNYILMKKRLYISAGLAYMNVREDFNYPGMDKSVNTFEYLDINIFGGYRIKRNRLSLVITGGGVASRQFSSAGYTISEIDTISAVDINSKKRFHNNSYSLAVGLKFIYELSYKISLMVEPYYRGNISSIVSRNEFYTEQRNFLGSKIGFLYAF